MLRAESLIFRVTIRPVIADSPVSLHCSARPVGFKQKGHLSRFPTLLLLLYPHSLDCFLQINLFWQYNDDLSGVSTKSSFRTLSLTKKREF